MIKITIGSVKIEFKDYDDFKKFVKDFEPLLKAKEPVYIPQPYPVYPYPIYPEPWRPYEPTIIWTETKTYVSGDNGESGNATITYNPKETHQVSYTVN